MVVHSYDGNAECILFSADVNHSRPRAHSFQRPCRAVYLAYYASIQDANLDAALSNEVLLDRVRQRTVAVEEPRSHCRDIAVIHMLCDFQRVSNVSLRRFRRILIRDAADSILPTHAFFEPFVDSSKFCSQQFRRGTSLRFVHRGRYTRYYAIISIRQPYFRQFTILPEAYRLPATFSAHNSLF